jgi:crotonobetainyl-CoA:carnitine CoA-transferase CaiB-like acyl-CoA transferase
VYETSAGLLMLAGEFKFIWHQLNTICGVVDGLDTASPVSLEEKISVRRAATLQFFCETCKTRAAVIAALDRMNIAWGDVRPATDIRELACVQSRGTITDVDNREGGTRPTTQSPYRYRRLESRVRAGAPYLGEHNAMVLAEWLSWTQHEISEYSDVLIAQSPAE